MSQGLYLGFYPSPSVKVITVRPETKYVQSFMKFTCQNNWNKEILVLTIYNKLLLFHYIVYGISQFIHNELSKVIGKPLTIHCKTKKHCTIICQRVDIKSSFFQRCWEILLLNNDTTITYINIIKISSIWYTHFSQTPEDLI